MSQKLIDVSKLNQTLITYDKALRALPFATLQEVAAKLGLNVMDLQGKHALINERRRAGGTQSYKIGKNFRLVDKLLGYEPSVIEPKDVVCITKENSQKYDDGELLIVGGQPVSNINKKHPLETRVAFTLVKSHVEDVVYTLFHAERDEDSTSPSGAFDGLFTKADMLITTGDVNAARGNFAPSGLFALPTKDTDSAAYENLVEWIGGANTYLRSSKSGIPQLLCAETVLIAARSALRNKLSMQEYPSMQRMIELLREDAMCPALEILSHEALGQGSRLILQKKGNMDVAFNTQAATKFVISTKIRMNGSSGCKPVMTPVSATGMKKYTAVMSKRMNLLTSQETIARPEAYKLISQERRMLSGASKAKLLNVAMVNASSV